jgi:hypothetical protein
MSYAHKIDGMVGQHLAGWQLEITLASQLRGRQPQVILPNGYAAGTYHPRQPRPGAVNPGFVSHPGGTLRNGVPKVLGLDFRGQYPLGAYNPGRPTL